MSDGSKGLTVNLKFSSSSHVAKYQLLRKIDIVYLFESKTVCIIIFFADTKINICTLLTSLKR